MNKNIEEENQISTITENPFASAILIGEYCALSANEIVCFENKFNSSLIPVRFLIQLALPNAYWIFTPETNLHKMKRSSHTLFDCVQEHQTYNRKGK